MDKYECLNNLKFIENKSSDEILADFIEKIWGLGIQTDRDNGNVGNNFSAKLLRIASETNKMVNLSKMPRHLSILHKKYLYYHDLDSYNLTLNCLHTNLGKTLSNSFNTGYGTIRKPKRIDSAASLSCILLQSNQNDLFGGQAFNDFDNDISEYVAITKKTLEEEYQELRIVMPLNKFQEVIEKKLKVKIQQAMQNILYNLNSMHSRAGSQVPFSSLNIGIPKNHYAAMICEALLNEYDKGMGKGEQMIFPNIIFRLKNGINLKENDPYYYLFELATKVASNRLNPTFLNIDAVHNIGLYNNGIIPAVMGCRTYINANVNGKEGPASRGNNFATTINLPRIALSSGKDVIKFFEILDEMLNYVYEISMHRYQTLCQLKVKDLPFAAGQKMMAGSEALSENDSIEPILKNGTIAVGFIGLAETLIALTGKHHGELSNSWQLGYKIVSYIRNWCDAKKISTSLNWSCYATPAEGLSGVFVKEDRKDYGNIPGVTDKDYYTNSYAIPVYYKIYSLEKLKLEAPFHELCNGGHISYIEVDGKPDPKYIENVIRTSFTEYKELSYVGINFHKRYCKDCGLDIMPHSNTCTCGSRKIQGVSRITGYLSLDERFGEGKKAEKEDRIDHTNYVHNYKEEYL